jgi:hypothetical protein
VAKSGFESKQPTDHLGIPLVKNERKRKKTRTDSKVVTRGRKQKACFLK